MGWTVSGVEDAQIKISAVLSNLHGVTGRAIRVLGMRLLAPPRPPPRTNLNPQPDPPDKPIAIKKPR